MNTVLKAICLAVYATALASMVVALPEAVASPARIVALLLLAAHALEAAVFLRHVRLYKGSLAVSLVLTLLFGLLHWKPMADAAARTGAAGR
jgi:uncharacterized protein YhhL (DUF1145 family)